MSRFKSASLLAISSGLNVITGIIVGAVLSRYMEEADYGTYKQVILPAATAAGILVFGIPMAVYHFFPSDGDFRGKTFWNSFYLLTLIGVGWLAFIYLGGAETISKQFNNPDVASYLRISAFGTSALVVSAGAYPILVSSKKNTLLLLISALMLAIKIGITLSVFFSFGSVESVIFAYTGNSIIFASLLLGVAFIYGAGSFQKPDIKLLKEMVKFGGILGIASLLGTFQKKLGSFIVASMESPEQFAVFENGAIEVPFTGVIQGAVVAVLMVEMTNLLGNKETAKAHAIWRRAVTKVSMIFIPLSGFMFVCSKEIMVFVFGEKYESSGSVFAVYCLLLPFRSISYGAVFIAAGKKDLVLKSAFVGVISIIILTPVCVILFGMLGAAIGNLISLVLVLVPWLFFKVKEVFGVELKEMLPWRIILKILFLTFVSAVGIFFVGTLIGDLVVTLRIGFLGFVYFSFLVWMFDRCDYINIREFRISI